MAIESPILEFRQISKSFSGTRVLTDVSFPLGQGRVLGLVGENGAGKSTLMNVLGGNLSADRGEMRFDGQLFAPQNPQQAADVGIRLAHQELNLFPNLSLAENLFLTDFPRVRALGFPWIDRQSLHHRTLRLLEPVGLNRPPDTPVEALSAGERQLVEIAKALQGDPRIIVLDEPTSSLGPAEAQRLFQIMDQLRAQNVSIIYISHNLGDVLRLCDEVVVLRDGEVRAAGAAKDFDLEKLIAAMVGRSLQALFPVRKQAPAEEVLLDVAGLSQPGRINEVSFSLHRNEVLGISGLMGAGRTELARILFGLDPFQEGQIRINGKTLPRPSPRECIRHGMAFLTEDRREEGLMMEASVEDNMALVSLEQFAVKPWGLIRQQKLRDRVAELAQSLNVDSRQLARQPVQTLSGGNQQKVVLAKWFLGEAQVFILDEPTRGVDVGAKCEIYQQIADLADQGAAILLISSELEELVGLCDRILVMAEGRIQSVVDKVEFDRHEMLRSALGVARLQ